MHRIFMSVLVNVESELFHCPVRYKIRQHTSGGWYLRFARPSLALDRHKVKKGHQFAAEMMGPVQKRNLPRTNHEECTERR